MAPSTAPARLRRSQYLSTFAHMGAVFLYHDLYGYLLEMSPDIVELIDAFAGGADTATVATRFAGTFGEQSPEQFVEILVAHAVLIEPDEDELDGIWPFVPVKAKWNVWRRDGERLSLWTAWGEAPIHQLALDEDETRMWDAFDGEKRLAELKMKFDPAKLSALARRLVHSDVQALRLGMMPMSTYAKRPSSTPNYLTSTMPYKRWQPGQSTGALGHEVSPATYYQEEIADAQAQFDHRETTLSHLLRIPHPTLGGRTYGAALVDALAARGVVPIAGRIRVLEIGGGLGYVAAAVTTALQARGLEVEYRILELAPALAAAQGARCAALPVTITLGDVLQAEPGDGRWDLILANEMIGDLPAVQLSRADVGMPVEGSGEVDPAKLAALGRTGELVTTLGVNLDDAPEPFYLLTGALELMTRLARWVAPGGTAVVTEFGDKSKWPRLSSHLDHPELSTHFGHLEQAAKALGLTSELVFVIDLIDIDRAAQGLATTRSHFRALRALLAAAGAELPKVGYTPAMLDELLATAGLSRAQLGDLRFDKIEDRLMGLVPHEFRALIASRPRAAAGQA